MMDYRGDIPTTYECVCEWLAALAGSFPALTLGVFGESILCRQLWVVRIGEGTNGPLFVGTHHGMEHLTARLLLQFTEDVLNAAKSGERLAGGFDIGYLLRHRSLSVVPMLNPDGVGIALGGAESAGILKNRLLSMNGGNRNFATWQANARGVDLNHNYNAGFTLYKQTERTLGIIGGAPTRYAGEKPESEPETAALCRLTRFLTPRCVLALHTQGEEIYWNYDGNAPDGARALAECFASVSGYRLSEAEGAAAHSGYKDWVIDSLGIPAFTVECGRGKNPLPATDFTEIYKKTLPILLTASFF